jgi:hypothetical protein
LYLCLCALGFVLGGSQDLLASVITTLEIDSVQEGRFTALRVNVIGGGWKLVVRSSFVSAAFGMSSLRVGHIEAKVRAF